MVKSNELRIPALPLEEFDFDVLHLSLAAEASSLGGAFKLHRLYNDTCDEGIAIRSGTGMVERFVLRETRREPDGEVIAWDFAPLNRSLKTVTRLTVFNN